MSAFCLISIMSLTRAIIKFKPTGQLTAKDPLSVPVPDGTTVDSVKAKLEAYFSPTKSQILFVTEDCADGIAVELSEVVVRIQSLLDGATETLPWEGADTDNGRVTFNISTANRPKAPTPAAERTARTGSSASAAGSKSWLSFLRRSAAKYCSRADTGAYHTKEGSQDGSQEAAWELGYSAALASVKAEYDLVDSEQVSEATSAAQVSANACCGPADLWATTNLPRNQQILC